MKPEKKRPPKYRLNDDDYCFVCGRANPIGLKLSFELDLSRHEVFTMFQPERIHQGWTNKLHGGILTSILDEAMVNAAYLSDMPAVTGELTIRFRAPADTTQRLKVVGRVTEVRAKFLKASGECLTEDGTRVAEATALLIRMS